MKRKTKAQREQEQRASLHQRIADVYSGAQGSSWDDAVDFATAEILSRVIPVLQSEFGTEERRCLFGPHCLAYFDTPSSAADHLFRNGVRT